MAGSGKGTEVARAYVSILPKLSQEWKSLANNVSNSLGGSLKKGLSSAGVAAGQLLANGIQSALGGVGSLISESIDYSDAMARFPLVVGALGVSAEDSAKSVEKLKQGLKGTPMLVSEAATTVQRLTASTGDIDKSTKWFLAMNNAVLAGAAPLQVQQSALEQWQQAVAKGRPDLIEFRSFMTAFPGTMSALAKKFGTTSDGLRDMFKDGKLTMEQFNEALVELNENGIDGFEKLSEQAKRSMVGMKTGLGLIKKELVETFGGMFTKLNISSQMGVFQNIGTGLSGVLNNALNPAIDTLAKWVEKATNILGNADIWSGLQNKSAFFGEIFASDLEHLVSAAKSVVDRVSPELEKVFDTALNASKKWAEAIDRWSPNMGSFFAGFIDGARKAYNLLSDILIKIGDIVNKIPQIPVDFLSDKAKLFGFDTSEVDDNKGQIVADASKYLGEFAGALAGVGIAGKIAISIIKKFVGFGKGIADFAGRIGDATKETGQLAEKGEKATKSTRRLKQNFGQLAGKALEFVGMGAGLFLAGLGIKFIAEGAALLSDKGAAGAAIFGEMALAAGLLMAEMALLGDKLTFSAFGIIALGGALALAGAGMWLIADAAVKVKESEAEIVFAGMVGAIGALAMVFAYLGVELDVAIPAVLAIAGLILAAGFATKLWCEGVALVLEKLTPFIEKCGEVAEKLGFTNKEATDAESAFWKFGNTILDIVGSAGKFVGALGSIAAGVGKAVEGVGYGILAWGLGAVADSLNRIKDAGEGAFNKIDSIAWASDNAGGALGNLKSTAENTANSIRIDFDNLSNNIWGVANQIVGSMGWCFNSVESSGWGACWNIHNSFNWLSNDLWGVANQIAGSLTYGFELAKNNIIQILVELSQRIAEILNQITSSVSNIHIPTPSTLSYAGSYTNDGLMANGSTNVLPNRISVRNRIPYATQNGFNAGAIYNITFNNATLNDDIEIRNSAMNLLKDVRRKENM